MATLDSALARQWLTGRDDESRADLIGVRFDDQGHAWVEPIEVKAHFTDRELSVQRDPRSRRPTLAGRAIEQLTNMTHSLEPIFGGADRQPLFTPARRESLKYQLHRECFRDIYDHEMQERWYSQLQGILALPSPRVPVHVSGIAIHVRFEELSGTEVVVDANQNLRLVRLGARTIQQLLTDDGSDPTLPPGTDFPDNSGDSPPVLPSRPPTPTVTAPKRTRAPKANTRLSHRSHQTKSVSGEDSTPENLEQLAVAFRRGCQSFAIQLSECEASETIVGPNVIRMYFRLARGQRLDPVRNAIEDIGREMQRTGLIVSTIANSDRLALDVPRLAVESVDISEALSMIEVGAAVEDLPIPIGVTPEGEHIIRDLAKMPHLLIGGTTGAGKTVFLYGLLASLLHSHPQPDTLRLVLSTSKREDFSFFEGVQHLEGKDVLDDAAAAVALLQGAIQDEFASRAARLTEARCRDIVAYNRKPANRMVPFIIVVDEFADLADQLGTERRARAAFYTSIRRIAQMGRSRGMHLVLCTQRPSAELLPSDIRSLMNCRVAFRVNKREDSRMIIDDFGADQLQMNGDLLFKDDKGIRRALGYFTDTAVLANLAVQSSHSERGRPKRRRK